MNDLLGLEVVHPEWHNVLKKAFCMLDQGYLQHLNETQDWLPTRQRLLAAFSQPLSSTRYILLGESPYPREQSANGYAFWDAQVDLLWSPTGLSKAVNRATSLRNFIKMLLFARGDLSQNCSQEAIAKLDKTHYIKTVNQLFTSLTEQGFLLLNASLVYSKGQVPYHARMWRPFMHCLLNELAKNHAHLTLILFGKIAAQLPEAHQFPCLVAEHPYNLSFITNTAVVEFFKPMDLLYEKHSRYG